MDGEVTTTLWRPERPAGLARLDAFAPRAGKAYSATRNFDFGPGARDNVSALSPWIRHRLILEEEVLRATLARHSFSAAEKFVQEVYWRAYFKGWLERRPEVWTRYRREVTRGAEALDRDVALRGRYEDAVAGRTGIDGFDDWAQELVATGWLHNHARMWFASIWIFTLKLPWALGADFFYRHLIDGDPASNTLSWRWVAGLHTKGKTYLARAANVEKYTDGRFRPRGLAPDAAPLTEVPLPGPQPTPTGERHRGDAFGLLLLEEDCYPETLDLPHAPSAIMTLEAASRRSPMAVGEHARTFSRGALADAAARAEAAFGVKASAAPEGAGARAVIDWAQANRINFVAVARPPVGPSAEILDDAAADLEAAGVRLVRVMRAYDEIAWPHAHKGFFALKQKIPAMLAELGLP